MSELNLLIINGDLPIFPGRAGHEYLHTTHLTQLARQVGLVSLVHTREQYEKKQGLANAGVALYLWESPYLVVESPAAPAVRRSVMRRVGKSLLQAFQAGLSRPCDTLIEDFQFRNLSGPLLKALDDETWQALIIVQSKCARWLDYVPRFPVSVLVMHDVRARVYELRAQTAASVRERLSLWLEAQRYCRFERKYCRKFDLVVTVSPADEAWVREHYHPTRLVTVLIPVDGDYFAPMPDVCEATTRIIFTGMMDHPPNVDAACFFAREVLPRVQRVIPEAEFWIVGRDPTPQVRALAGLPGVVVTGFVSDIRPHIAQATVVVVPLRFGSGMRNKILEAWAMQKCVVSTTVGAEGLDYQDGENILIADSAESMADRVIEVLRNPQRREQIRLQGRQVITIQHDPNRLAHQYYQAVASVVHEKRQRGGPMRVVIDLRWMHPGVAGGIENLSRSFIKHLLLLDRFNCYTLLVPTEIRYDFDLRSNPHFRVLALEGPGNDWRQLMRRVTRFLYRCLKVDNWRSPEVETLLRVRALEAEVALSIPGYIHPDLSLLSNVLIVPDLQHEYYPEFFSEQDAAERRRIYRDAVQRAHHICAISEFTRQSLIERLNVPPERVTATPLAADPIFHPDSPYRVNHRRVLDKYKLQASEYLFFPGNTWPHKNHRAAFHALRILQEAYHLDPLLVCTGSAKEAHPELVTLIRELHLDDRVKFLGYCPATEIPALYEGAAALVFPSFFEGFGIPLTEAMWCDCPIVCSNATSLPEIAGDAALLVDPRSPEQLAEAIARVLTDSHLRQQLIERGREQVKKFSWQTFTIEVVRILRQVYDMRYG